MEYNWTIWKEKETNWWFPYVEHFSINDFNFNSISRFMWTCFLATFIRIQRRNVQVCEEAFIHHQIQLNHEEMEKTKNESTKKWKRILRPFDALNIKSSMLMTFCSSSKHHGSNGKKKTSEWWIIHLWRIKNLQNTHQHALMEEPNKFQRNAHLVLHLSICHNNFKIWKLL